MSKYPVEALLRPPVEYYSAASYLAIGFLASFMPSTLMMTKSVAYISAAALIILGLIRLSQGMRVRRYQKGLKRLKPYTVSSKTLPVSDKKLFLGLGFSWDGRHTQRLANLTRTEGRKYKEQSFLFHWARRFETKHEHSSWYIALFGSKNKKGFKSILDRFLRKHRWFPLFLLLKYFLDSNPFNSLPPVGGDPSLHAVGLYEGEESIYMDLGDRVGHTLVLGTTRVGKSRLAELFIAQDIRRGDVTIVFDPKGDAALFMRMYVEAMKAGRLDNFYFFHLGYPEISARYNPVGSFARITEVATRIANQLPGEGQSAAFREFVWRYVNVISKALTALGRKSDYEQILDFGQDIEPLVNDYMEMLATNDDPSGQWRDKVAYIKEAFEDSDNKDYRVPREMSARDRSIIAVTRYCKDNDLIDPVGKSLARTYEYDRGYFDKLVSSLLPLMEKLTTGKCSELLSPDYLDQDDTRPIFDWAQIVRSKGIVYVGLDALTDPEVAGAVGNAMFSDLTSMAGSMYKHGINQGLPHIETGNTKINIHADEFNELIGPEFIPMLNKAGGAGVQVTAYTQTWSDVEARLQDKAKAGQVAGNFNSIFMLRVREQATAEMLTEQLQQTEINHLMLVSGATDSSDHESDKHFVSKTEQRITTQQVDLIHPNYVMTLPKGQAFALLDGGKPHKLRLPLPDDSDFDEIPDTLHAVADEMKNRYSTSEDWYQFTPSWQEAA